MAEDERRTCRYGRRAGSCRAGWTAAHDLVLRHAGQVERVVRQQVVGVVVNPARQLVEVEVDRDAAWILGAQVLARRHRPVLRARLLDSEDRVLVHELKPLYAACSTRTHTHPFNGPFSGTTRVGRYQKGKTNLDFTGQRQ